MTDTRFARSDLSALEELITDEDIDLETFVWARDDQVVFLDVLKVDRDDARIEKERKQSVTVCPIVRRKVQLRNVTDLQRRIGKSAGSKLRGVTIQRRKEGTVEIVGCRGRLVLTAPHLEIELGPESETDYECVHRKLWGRIGYWKWRLKQTSCKSESER